MKTIVFLLIIGVTALASTRTSLAQQANTEGLNYQGRSLSEWIVSFEKGTPRNEREQASKAVQAIGRQAVPYLIAILTNDVNQTITSEDTQKWRAIHALICLEAEAEAAIPALIGCLDYHNEEIQIQAMVALAQIGKQPKPVVPALEKMLDSANSRVRKYAVMTIWAGFRSSELAKPALSKALDDRDEAVRQMASRALSGENPDPGVWKTK